MGLKQEEPHRQNSWVPEAFELSEGGEGGSLEQKCKAIGEIKFLDKRQKQKKFRIKIKFKKINRKAKQKGSNFTTKLIKNNPE